MIDSIKLIRFKQFKETEIQLRPFSVLMGENNSGKTTVLQAIWLALHSLHQGKLLSVDRKTLETRVSSTGYYMHDVPFAPKDELSSLFYNKISRGGSTYDENSGAILQVKDDRGNNVRLHLRDLFKNLNFKILTPEEEVRNPELQKYEPLYISGFSGLSFQEERMFPAVLESRIAAGDVNSIVRNILLDLKLRSPEKYQYLESLLEHEFGFRIRELHFHEKEELYVVSEYEENYREDSVSLEFGSCGSGIMQILQILSVMLRYCPEKTRVVLIDEPETHLHGNLQVKFLDILMKMQQELGIQIILSTHSEAMIRNAEPEDVIPVLAHAAVNHSLSGSAGVPEVVLERLNAYQLGKAKISGKLAFFEESNLEVFEKMADALRMDSFFGLNTVPMICGCRRDDRFPFTLRSALQELLGREVEIHIVYGANGMPEETQAELRQFAGEHGVCLHILPRYETENYLLSAELILRTLRADGRNADRQIPEIEEIQEKINWELRKTLGSNRSASSEKTVYADGEHEIGENTAHETIFQTVIQDDTYEYDTYEYETVLSENLYKTRHTVLGRKEYKFDQSELEAAQICMQYRAEQDSQKLCEIGMGSRACAQVFAWLTRERGLRISRKSMLRQLRAEDISAEIRELLGDLQADLTAFQPIEAKPEPVQRKDTYEQLSFLDL